MYNKDEKMLKIIRPKKATMKTTDKRWRKNLRKKNKIAKTKGMTQVAVQQKLESKVWKKLTHPEAKIVTKSQIEALGT